MSALQTQAYSVLFPVVDGLELNEDLRRFFGCGGRSLLFGETAEEYRRGEMSASRIAFETLERWQTLTSEVHCLAGPSLLAADADISAVHRLQGVAPLLPEPEVAREMDIGELETMCFKVGTAVREAGVNIVLSPTADVLEGSNVWLDGRTLSDDVAKAAAMVGSYVRGVRRANVAATLKHFPGHPRLLKQPSTEEAKVHETLDQLRVFWPSFRAGIEAGAEAVMMGSAIFTGLKKPESASLSSQLIELLRAELGFSGLIMTIDLDHRSMMKNLPIGEVAVAALIAGADLLLIPSKAVREIPQIVSAITSAVERGTLPRERLDSASTAVLKLANRQDRR